MRAVYLLASLSPAVLISVAGSSCGRYYGSADDDGRVRAVAELHDVSGAVAGRAVFTRVSTGVNIDAAFQNLPPGAHAMHIHEKGICDPPEFQTAGGHFDPKDAAHGLADPAGPHAGDMANVEIGDDGKASVRRQNLRVDLAPASTNSLFKPGGTALIIHAGPDDHITDPSGGSGKRIACGVIVLDQAP